MKVNLNDYIIEKLRLDKNVPRQKLPLEDKLKEICDQCVKDEDFEWYRIEKSKKNQIYIYLPKEVRKYFNVIKEIIETNLEGKYDVKNIGYNFEKSFIIIHV